MRVTRWGLRAAWELRRARSFPDVRTRFARPQVKKVAPKKSPAKKAAKKAVAKKSPAKKTVKKTAPKKK